MSQQNRPRNPIVLVDDDPEILKSTELLLRSEGFNNFHVEGDSRMVLPFLDQHKAEVVILDLSMPFISGEELLGRLRDRHPEIPVLILTSTSDLQAQTRCIRAGASDFVVKPFEKERLARLISRLNTISDLRKENDELRTQLLGKPPARPEAFDDIVTQDRTMLALINYVCACARMNVPILIRGEPGVGKELFARGIHRASARSGPFLKASVAGLDDDSFTELLFGRRKGAFGGSDPTQVGLVKKAEGGTLFLHEIEGLSSESQAKLLRLLRHNEYLALGSGIPQRSETDLVFASGTKLAGDESRTSFRRDLYFYLSAHSVTIPPLRDRALEDLALLTEHFAKISSEKLQRKTLAVPPDLLPALRAYSFPGNVRQLEQMVHEGVGQSHSGFLDFQWFSDRIEAYRQFDSQPEGEDAEMSLPTRGGRVAST